MQSANLQVGTVVSAMVLQLRTFLGLTAAAGMCFSIEPGLYLPGSFGVRLEDCVYVDANGPRWFTRPPASIDAPFG